MSREAIIQELTQAQDVLDRFISNGENLEAVLKGAALFSERLENGGRVFSCGNGGSMSDAMHFAEELSGRFRAHRPSIGAMAISDSGHITCTANDYGYEEIFSRFVEGFCKKEDALLAISTSGNSENVIRAAKSAKQKGMVVIGLLGETGGKLKDICDVSVCVPHSGASDRIQEIHIKVIHIWVMLIEKALNV
jgi:D-sedoheptulose 7-phosphate isomerase